VSHEVFFVMINEPVGLPVTKPLSAWNKPLQANFKSLFGALTKGTIYAGTQNWSDAAAAALEGVAALGLGKDAGEVAWSLIFGAINRAIADLIRDNKSLLFEEPEYRAGHDATFEAALGKLERSRLTVDINFFNNPKSLKIVETIQPPLALWLEGLLGTKRKQK